MLRDFHNSVTSLILNLSDDQASLGMHVYGFILDELYYILNLILHNHL